jgi:hypothetical protein
LEDMKHRSEKFPCLINYTETTSKGSKV